MDPGKDEESLSETEDSELSKTSPLGPPTHSGTCSKWTNYIHGWQERYIVLKDGTLAYYKSENETGFGCRGAISITKAIVKLHEFDECRFDISVGDCVWYLRAEHFDARNKWVESIENYKHYLDSGYGSEASLRRQGSTLSLGSVSIGSKNGQICPSTTTMAKNGNGWGLLEKINEVETYRDILCRQIDSLQSYLDTYGDAVNDTLIKNNPTLTLNDSSSSSSSSSSVTLINTSDTMDSCPQSSQSLECTKNNSVNGQSIDNQSTNNKPNKSNCGQSSINSVSKPVCDFKGEAITFKATTAGILATLTHCIDMMQQREENWKRRLEKEVEKRKKLEEIINSRDQILSSATLSTSGGHRRTLSATSVTSKAQILGPDYEEGPHSKIKEEEFFDALDAMLDKADQQQEEKRILKQKCKEIGEPSSRLPSKVDHPLWSEIDDTTKTQLYFAQLDVDESPDSCNGTPTHGAKNSNSANSNFGAKNSNSETNGHWTLFAEEGELRLYKRELEVDGLVCDPLKAVHIVKGVTAHEMCYHFFSPDVRFDWENTLESMKVIEEINPNTIIFHQIHKRVWPAAQRDTVFWSHIRRVSRNRSDSDSEDTEELENMENDGRIANTSTKYWNGQEPHDVWVVCNNSTDKIDVPLGRCVRMKMTVSLACETYIDPAAIKDGRSLTRDDITCRIIYCSTINPGGWAPAGVLRALYKREYPKFLKRFTAYVIEAQENKPIMF